MKKTKLTRSLLAACSIVALSAVMHGCSSSGENAANTRAQNAEEVLQALQDAYDGAGLSLILPEGFNVSTGAEYRRTDYGSGWFPHVPDNGARVDRTRSLRASLHNRGITVLGFSPEVSLVYEKRDTNAQLHDFERTRGELRFVRQF